MDLTVLANEGIPVLTLNEIAPEFGKFATDSSIEVLTHSVRSWASNNKFVDHTIIAKIKESQCYSLFTFAYISFTQSPKMVMRDINVQFVDNYVFNSILQVSQGVAI